MFSKILVPYDGFEYSENALNKAIYIAKLTRGSKLHILTVIEEVKAPFLVFDTKIRNYKTGEVTTLSSYLRDLQKENRRKTMNRLDELKRKYHNVEIKTLVSIGKPEAKILEYAKSQHIDLIVMGSRSVNGIFRFLLGSVSRGVSEKVNCTVMIVK